MDAKVQPTHLDRSAIVYVRQSSFVQVENNRESTRRQYDLVARARELGWRDDQVSVIDEDQGHSGATTQGRSGFARVMSEVALGQVGIVLAIEASRLARNNADWQRLIWFCSLTETLLGDQDGLYDPCRLDDRMVLGLKGTISELEWHTMRKRLSEAALNKARRGELEVRLPAGLEWCETGGILLSPDRQVVDTLMLVYDKFDEAGSARQTALWLRAHGVKLPRREADKAGGPVRWVEATNHAVHSILTQPAYAGAYVYGRRRIVRQIDSDGSVRPRAMELPPEEWKVQIRDHHPGLIDWQRYERVQRQLMENRTTLPGAAPGPVREGGALLQGLVYCGICARRMGVAYTGRGRRFGQYICVRRLEERGEEYCQSLGGRRIEEAVVDLFLDALQPVSIEVAIGALQGLREERGRLTRHWEQRIERAEYEAELARRRYEAVDPANRLVAGELESRWNEALTAATRVRREADEALRGVTRELSATEQERIRRMAGDIRQIWMGQATTPRDRKRLLRTVIEKVVLKPLEHSVKIAVEWKGGEVNELAIKRLRRGEPTNATDQEVVELVRKLAVEGGLDDRQIARVLMQRNLRTASGLTFTQVRVQSVRRQYDIARGSGPSAGEPRLTAEEAARVLDVSSQTIHAWLRAGLLRGEQVAAGAPWRITLDAATRQRLAGEEAPEGWAGLEEAARQLGVSKQTVSSWVKSGKLHAVRVARGRRKGWRIRVVSMGYERQPGLGLTKPSTERR